MTTGPGTPSMLAISSSLGSCLVFLGVVATAFGLFWLIAHLIEASGNTWYPD